MVFSMVFLYMVFHGFPLVSLVLLKAVLGA